MKESYRAVKISEQVYWVGAVDWGVRDFHGYSTGRGTTYNAYLVLADKITLIDTVKAPFKEELLARIASVVDPGEINYLVSNHAEMDHSGCLAEVMRVARPEKVFASTMGVRALTEHFHLDEEIVPVKDGSGLSLGNRQLTFYETRMLHWPDSMVSYLSEEGVLFSQDAFGMHLASSERFAAEIADHILEEEGARYFANILLPYSGLVTKLLRKMEGLGIPLRIVAPDHGPIWREEPGKMVEWYSRWAAQKPTEKAVVVYDTMWQSTAAMARAIVEGLTTGGVRATLMPLKSCHRSDVAAEILDAGALLVGSPTINNNLFPTVADLLAYLRGLRPANLVGAAFGSYGWSGEAVGQVNEILKEMKVTILGEGLKVKYVPEETALLKCFSLGSGVAKELREGRE